MKTVFYNMPRQFAAAAIFAAVLGAPNAAACKLCDAASAKNLNEVRKLLDRGENINGKKNGKPAIIHAAESNRVDIVRLMLDRGADANARDKGNETGVFSAAWRGNAEIAQLLIDRGASFDHTNNTGNSPLHLAAFKNRPEVVEVLARMGADLNRRDRKKKTPLLIAVENDNTAAVRALVRARANVNVLVDADKNETVLHAAAWRGNKDIVKLLAESNADFSIRNKWGDTPLKLAEKRGHRESARILQGADKCLLCDAARDNNRAEARRLIESGVDVNKTDHQTADWAGGRGLTALHRAAQRGHPDMVKILLDAGARTDIAANRFGSPFYPLTYAVWHNKSGAIIALLDGGADPNLVVRSAGIEEPSIVAMARLGNVEAAKKFLEKGADPNVRGHRGGSLRNSPLIWAVDKNNAEMVKVLLKHNADPGMWGGYGGTPVLAAVKKNNGGMVEQFLRKSRAAGEHALVHLAGDSDNNKHLKFLLDRGVSPDAADAEQDGKTALMAAAENDHMENVILLMNSGANPDKADDNGKTTWDIVANKFLIKSVLQDIVGRQYGVSIDGRREVGTPTSERPCTEYEIIKSARCIPCGDNSVPNEAKTECVINCPAGQFGGTGRWNPRGERHIACSPCPANAVSPAGPAQTCTTCTATEKPNADRSACVFACGENQIAQYGRCVSCGDNTEPNEAKTHCVITCPPGQFGTLGAWNPNGQRHIDCRQCPANTARAAHQHRCTPCAEGTAPNADRSACVAR